MEYATAELRFSDKQTMALYTSLSEEDRATFAFDTAVDRLAALLPSRCTARPSRRRSAGSTSSARCARGRPPAGSRQVAAPSGTGIAAFFDMDGTLLSSNVIETYLWVRLRELDGAERFAELGRIAVQGAEPRAGRAPLSAATSCAGSTASTTAPGSPTSTRSPTST